MKCLYLKAAEKSYLQKTFRKQTSFLQFPMVAARRCSTKKMFLKSLQNSQENICVVASFFNKTTAMPASEYDYFQFFSNFLQNTTNATNATNKR